MEELSRQLIAVSENSRVEEHDGGESHIFGILPVCQCVDNDQSITGYVCRSLRAIPKQVAKVFC